MLQNSVLLKQQQGNKKLGVGQRLESRFWCIAQFTSYCTLIKSARLVGRSIEHRDYEDGLYPLHLKLLCAACH